MGSRPRPFVVSMMFTVYLYQVSLRRYYHYASKSSREKWPKLDSLGATYLREVTPKCLRRFVSAMYLLPLAKFGWVPFRWLDAMCQAWHWSKMQYLWRVGNTFGHIKAVYGPKSMNSWEIVGNPLWFQSCAPFVHIVFRLEDIGRWNRRWVAKLLHKKRQT